MFLNYGMKINWLQFITGFIVLFVIYHFPEFFSALWIAAVFKIGFLVVAFFIARWQGWKGLDGFGLSLHKAWIKNLLLGLIVGICFFLLSELIAVKAGYEKYISIQSVSSIVQQLPLILLMTFFPSIAEDILTRGYLFTHLNRKMAPAVFIVLSATVYVLNHIWRLSEGISVLSYLFVLGITLAWAMAYTGTLWLTLGIHWGSNIAFQTMVTAAKTETINKTSATWVLAASFGIMWIATMVIKKIFVKENQPEALVTT